MKIQRLTVIVEHIQEFAVQKGALKDHHLLTDQVYSA